MKIYAYGIIDCGDDITGSVKGLEDASVFNIPFQDIGVAVSMLEKESRVIGQNQVLEHEEVVEKLMENFTVLPMRFLTVFDGEKDVLEMMREYYGDFKRNLEKLHGKVEFGIKVVWQAEEIREQMTKAYKDTDRKISSLASSPAKDFLVRKFEKYLIENRIAEEAKKWIAILDGNFSRFAVAKRLEKFKSGNLLLSANYLVEKESRNDFREIFEQTRDICSGLKFLLSGPWPPYNFIVLGKKSRPTTSFD